VPLEQSGSYALQSDIAYICVTGRPAAVALSLRYFGAYCIQRHHGLFG